MPYQQTGRLCTLTTPLGENVLLPRSLIGREAISEPFRFELELLSQNPAIDLEAIIGQPVTVAIALADGGHRFINAIVSRFVQIGAEGKLYSYRAEIVPWIWLLTRRTDCRVFQNLKVPEIVKQVFTRLGFLDFEFRLNGRYQPIVNCVQYRESDLNFVSRLLEEEGIFYYFEHEEGRHTLILADSPAFNVPCPGQATTIYDPVTGGNRAEDRLETWEVGRALCSGKYALSDFNYLDPATDLLVETKSSVGLATTATLENYDYPGAYVKIGAEHEAKLDKGEGRVRVRREEGDARAFVAHGSGGCRGFMPGFRFDLKSHPRAAWNEAWLLVAVEHELTQAGGWTTSDDGESRYENHVECIPHRTTYRPPRSSRKPLIRGPQTAIVTGPSGEEIHTDQHGRVKVQFHWDREGCRDERSSCWVRVSQQVAGKQWGAQFIPRIGQEVIVEYLDGDPDYPIITGRVYNGEQSIPYDTPTQSGIKSHSTKQGTSSNFNEIRYEDRKGAEELHIQAEKNMSIIVKNDRTESIRSNDTLGIGGNRSKSIGAAESINVAQDRNTKIGGDDMLVVAADSTESVGSNKSIGAGGNIGAQAGANIGLIAGGAVQIKAGTAISIECGASSITMTQAGLIKISGTIVMVDGAITAEMSAPIATISGLAVMQMGTLSVSSGEYAAVIGDNVAVQGTKKVRINC